MYYIIASHTVLHTLEPAHMSTKVPSTAAVDSVVCTTYSRRRRALLDDGSTSAHSEHIYISKYICDGSGVL